MLVNEFYRLKALITLEQVNTTERSKKIRILRAAVRKYRLGAGKMKKSKIPKLCQNIALGELFLEK